MADDPLLVYRNSLVAAEQKSQDDYDKSIVALSGGALAISIVFIKEVLGDREPVFVLFLITAWVFWALSLASVVASYYFSRAALRKAIEQADQKDYSEVVGGEASRVTSVLNVVSGLLFLLGIASLILFAMNNIGGTIMSGEERDDGKEKIERGYVPPPPPKRPPLTEGTIPPPPPPTENNESEDDSG